MAPNYHQLSLLDFASRNDNSGSGGALRATRLKRITLVSSLLVLWALVLLGRLYSLQISDFERWQEWAVKEHFKELVVASERGPIVDRNNKLMAVSVPAGSIYVRPRQVKNKQEVIDLLSANLKIPSSEVALKLVSKEPFVWIKRQVPRALAEKIQKQNIPGLGYVMESKRYYPFNHAASSLLGAVGIDGNGLSGLEGKYEKTLHTEHIKTLLSRDAVGNVIEINPQAASNFRLPKGDAIKLTLDSSLQQILDEELAIGREKANSKAAMGVLIDADSGEILAMGQSPSSNFNLGIPSSKKELRNLLLETVFEPGSIFKPIVAAAALEMGLVHASEIINCEGGHFGYGRHVIKDVHPYKLISFRDVLVRSSNIGMSKIGMRMGANSLHQALRTFGVGEDSGLGFPGETSGILRSADTWAKIDVATHSFGQGVAVTPLQMVRAISALANGGKLPTLKLVMDDQQLELKRIISERVANQVREMLYAVVEDEHGTGKAAQINGVRVGGKTGTAQKPNLGGRGYKEGAYIASFVGFAGGHDLGLNKTLSLIVVIDEPNTTSIYGGTLAAPVFKRIMQRSLHLLSTLSQLSPGSGQHMLRQRGV